MEVAPLLIAVDCTSGINADTGEAAPETLHADVTVSTAAVKQGMLKLPAYEFVGNLQVVDIGIPDAGSLTDPNQTTVAEEELVASILPVRPPGSHKGSFGTALIVAGSVNYTGAALLSSLPAYRIGAGVGDLSVP